jgi:predicted nucleic acid-binding protein
VGTPDSVETYIVDTWPVMEWLQQLEPGAAHFERLIERVLDGKLRLVMSRINFGEVLYSCWKLDPGQAAQLFADAETLPIDIISVDDDLVIEAARLKAGTTASYADCFAAALALRHNVPVVTGDKDFPDLVRVQPKLQVRWVGA